MDGNKKITVIVFAGIFALAITACKVQLPGYVGLYVDDLTSVTDTAVSGDMPRNMADTVMAEVVDTTNVDDAALPVFLNPVEETMNTSSDSVYQYEVEKLISAITDSIQLLEYQMTEIQKQLTENPSTSFTEEKSKEIQQLNRQQSNYQGQQQLRVKDEQIRTLKNRMNSMQNAAKNTPQRAPVSMVIPLQPLGSQQNNQLTQQIFQAQNDTIQFLKSQIQNLQLQPNKIDSVYIENEAKELQPTKEFFPGQNTVELQPLPDTMAMIENGVQSLEEPTSQGMETSALAQPVVKDVTSKAITDTIVAFYEQGRIKPIVEESVLKQIKELCSNKNVQKITLSGFTDSSGNEKVNKAITNKRITYLSENIIPWISEEKIYFQNFGDVFSSETVVNDERRIEIRIHSKQSF